MTGKSGLKGDMTILVVAIMAGLVLLEGIVRLAMPHWRDFHSGRFMTVVDVLGHERVPIGVPGFNGFFADNNGDFRVMIAINDFGQRNPEPVQAADGRIWVVGDSITFGWGVERDEMYSSVIGRIVGEPTYNIASPGTNICGYQTLLARMPSALRPKAVVVGVLLENDVGIYNCATKARSAAEVEGDSPSLSLVGIKIILIEHSALYNFVAISLKRVAVIKEALVAAKIIVREHSYKRFFREDDITAAAASTAEELVRMRAMLPAGTPFVAVIMPSRFELRDGDQPYRRVRMELGEELSKRGIDHVDLYRNFMDAGFAPTHFPHDGHWSPLGHEIAGKAISAWMARRR